MNMLCRLFEQDAFDYLLKPIDPARLEVTLKRLRRDRTPRPALFNAAAPLKQIPCPGHQRVLLVKIDDVGICHVQGDRGLYHHHSGW